MTNLLEKALITGFGIFILINFLILVLPFIDQLVDYREYNEDSIENYINFIDTVDNAINNILNDPSQIYTNQIEYPRRLNTTFQDQYAKFYFFIEDKLFYRIFEYNKSFYERYYENLPNAIYILRIFISSGKINLTLTQFT